MLTDIITLVRVQAELHVVKSTLTVLAVTNGFLEAIGRRYCKAPEQEKQSSQSLKEKPKERHEETENEKQPQQKPRVVSVTTKKSKRNLKASKNPIQLNPSAPVFVSHMNVQAVLPRS